MTDSLESGTKLTLLSAVCHVSSLMRNTESVYRPESPEDRYSISADSLLSWCGLCHELISLMEDGPLGPAAK